MSTLLICTYINIHRRAIQQPISSLCSSARYAWPKPPHSTSNCVMHIYPRISIHKQRSYTSTSGDEWAHTGLSRRPHTMLKVNSNQFVVDCKPINIFKTLVWFVLFRRSCILSWSSVKMAMEKYSTFFNGIKMPNIGYGTWRVRLFCTNCLSNAIVCLKY